MAFLCRDFRTQAFEELWPLNIALGPCAEALVKLRHAIIARTLSIKKQLRIDILMPIDMISYDKKWSPASQKPLPTLSGAATRSRRPIARSPAPYGSGSDRAKLLLRQRSSRRASPRPGGASDRRPRSP